MCNHQLLIIVAMMVIAVVPQSQHSSSESFEKEEGKKVKFGRLSMNSDLDK